MEDRTRDRKGYFLPGNPGKPKGARHSKTVKIREILQLAVGGHIEKIGEYIDEIEDPAKKVDVLAKLMPYVLPRLTSVEITSLTTVHELLSLSPEERRIRIETIQKQLNDKKQKAIA